jgi:ATP-dependent DNA helicase 2 subunit 2
MGHVRQLQELIQPSDTEVGDGISAIVIAVQMIQKFCKQLKYIRRVVLLTNARGGIDGDDFDSISNEIRKEGIELTIIGVDFDIGGIKEENKTQSKKHHEELLNQLAKMSGGKILSLEHAIRDMEIPTLKKVRPVVLYKGLLTIGDPEEYGSALSLEVERFPRVMVASAPTASRYVAAENLGAESMASSLTMQPSETGNDALAAVKQARTFQVEDADAPGGKMDVDKEDLEKGYEYGRTAVHISESDMNVVRLDTKQSLSICGFVGKAKVGVSYRLGEKLTVRSFSDTLR